MRSVERQMKRKYAVASGVFSAISGPTAPLSSTIMPVGIDVSTSAFA